MCMRIAYLLCGVHAGLCTQSSRMWSAAGRMDPGPVSVQGATGEVARVLGAQDLWEVLEVPRAPAEDVLKKAKRTKSLAVHPDKLPPATAGAPQAFVRVTQV